MTGKHQKRGEGERFLDTLSEGCFHDPYTGSRQRDCLGHRFGHGGRHAKRAKSDGGGV